MAWAVTADPERFEEADTWFRSRIPYTIEQYDALDDKARKQAFWITAALELDAVQTIFDELAKSNEKGTPFEEFQKNVEEKLGKLAPDGFHLETVYRNWVQKSYNTGRWYQLQAPELTLLRPYLMFDAVLDSRTTPTCQACDGIVKRHDDAFWLTHNPPLHHRCRSSLRSLRASEAQRRGITEGVPEGTDPQDDFGKAPPLAGDDEHLEPKQTRFDPEVWAEFKKRQGKMLEELAAANEAAKAARLIRDQQRPEYWFEREYKELYGDAGRAVAWGRAMEHRGLEMTAKKALTQYKKLVKAGTNDSVEEIEKSLEDVLTAMGLKGKERAKGLAEKPLRELAEFAAENGLDLEAADIRGMATLAGHSTSIKKMKRGAIVFEDIAHLPGAHLSEEEFEKALGDLVSFYEALSDVSLKQPVGVEVYADSKARGEYQFIKKKLYVGKGTLRTLVHEWAHALEEADELLADRAQEFFERRTTPFEVPVDLERWLNDEAYRGEIAKKDAFWHAYMGRVYGHGMTEVTTMAVQSLVDQGPGWMLVRDPDSLYFALGQLAGGKTR